MSIVLVAALCILIAAFWSKFALFVKKQLHIFQLAKKLPGPAAIPVLGNVLQIPTDIAMSKYFDELTQEYSKKGASGVRLWFAHILTFFPINGKTVKAILDNNEEIDKGSDYDIFEAWLGDGLLLSTGEKWKSQRRMLTPTFHFSMLDSYVCTMDRNAKILTDVLEPHADTGKIYNLFPLIKRCTLDIICETAMGHHLNSLSNVNQPYASAVERMGAIAIEYAFQPWLWSYYVRKALGWQAEFEGLLKTLKDFTTGVIQERIRSRELDGNYSESNRKAFLDMLLDMRETHSLTDDNLGEQVETFMFAGHETTSTAVSWTVWALATHPEIQERVAKEVIEVAGSAENITLKEIKEMPYLDLVLKESMRVNPPIPMVGRHLKNDLQMGDYTVPAGSNLYIAPMMIHRNPAVYPEPFRFDPDRFLPENSKTRHAYDYVPFSAGPRNCIGQKFAIYEAKVILIWLIRRYKFTAEMAFMDNIGVPEIAYRPQHGVPIVIQRRD